MPYGSDVSVSYNNIGDVRLDEGDRKGRLRRTRRTSPSPSASPPRTRAMPDGSAMSQ
jgi:hypothetical protein